MNGRAREWGTEQIPSIYLIGPDGTVLARDLEGDKIMEAVSAALNGTDRPSEEEK